MPIQLHNKQGETLYHRHPDPKSYSIFGENGAMNYAYEPISNIERNKKGLFEQKTRKNTSDSNKPENAAPFTELPDKDIKQGKTFNWSHGGNKVIITGDFDNWKGTTEMKPVNNVFVAHVNNLDFSRDIHYKFIVDGKWCIDKDVDTVKDEEGNVNNVIHANTDI